MASNVHLVELYLPVFGMDGRRISSRCFNEVRRELVEKFGGLTAHLRAPATGLWKPGPGHAPERDVVVIYEVMVATLERRWWRTYRAKLESRFRQESILIHSSPVRLL